MIIFYMWFDHQAMQLRYNIIEGEIEDVRKQFGCKINIVKSSKSIIESFVKASKANDTVEFLLKVEIEEEEEFICNIYIQIIEQKA